MDISPDHNCVFDRIVCGVVWRIKYSGDETLSCLGREPRLKTMHSNLSTVAADDGRDNDSTVRSSLLQF